MFCNLINFSLCDHSTFSPFNSFTSLWLFCNCFIVGCPIFTLADFFIYYSLLRCFVLFWLFPCLFYFPEFYVFFVDLGTSSAFYHFVGFFTVSYCDSLLCLYFVATSVYCVFYHLSYFYFFCHAPGFPDSVFVLLVIH